MASDALAGLIAGLQEIEALQRANPTPQEGGGLTRPHVVRAIGRSEVVLLSSHFERYIYAVNEDATEWLAQNNLATEALPEHVRLLHTKPVIDELAATQWDNRGQRLRQFVSSEVSLWSNGATITTLDAERLLSWMKAPKCNDLVRYYRLWGIEDIFSAITRSEVIRNRLWLRIQELVEKRNNIAHGDLTVEAQYTDIQQYRAAVRTFCERADGALARALGRISGAARPW